MAVPGSRTGSGAAGTRTGAPASRRWPDPSRAAGTSPTSRQNPAAGARALTGSARAHGARAQLCQPPLAWLLAPRDPPGLSGLRTNPARTAADSVSEAAPFPEVTALTSDFAAGGTFWNSYRTSHPPRSRGEGGRASPPRRLGPNRPPSRDPGAGRDGPASPVPSADTGTGGGWDKPAALGSGDAVPGRALHTPRTDAQSVLADAGHAAAPRCTKRPRPQAGARLCHSARVRHRHRCEAAPEPSPWPHTALPDQGQLRTSRAGAQGLLGTHSKWTAPRSWHRPRRFWLLLPPQPRTSGVSGRGRGPDTAPRG